MSRKGQLGQSRRSAALGNRDPRARRDADYRQSDTDTGRGMQRVDGKLEVRAGAGLAFTVRSELALIQAKRVATLSIGAIPSSLDAATATVAEAATVVNTLIDVVLAQRATINKMLEVSIMAGHMKKQ